VGELDVRLPAPFRMEQRSITSSLVIWRDSVCAGDDGDAPHEWRVPAAPEATVADVAGKLQSARYLASVSGGRATWILQGAGPLAVLAQEWEEPRFLVAPEAPVWDQVDRLARPHLLVKYWCQADPNRVFASLAAGEPLPDRYGA